MDSHILRVALLTKNNEPFVHCKVLRKSVIKDQARTVRHESGNGDMGVCTMQSSVISVHPLSAPPLCIIMPNT